MQFGNQDQQRLSAGWQNSCYYSSGWIGIFWKIYILESLFQCVVAVLCSFNKFFCSGSRFGIIGTLWHYAVSTCLVHQMDVHWLLCCFVTALSFESQTGDAESAAKRVKQNGCLLWYVWGVRELWTFSITNASGWNATQLLEQCSDTSADAYFVLWMHGTYHKVLREDEFNIFGVCFGLYWHRHSVFECSLFQFLPLRDAGVDVFMDLVRLQILACGTIILYCLFGSLLLDLESMVFYTFNFWCVLAVLKLFIVACCCKAYFNSGVALGWGRVAFDGTPCSLIDFLGYGWSLLRLYGWYTLTTFTTFWWMCVHSAWIYNSIIWSTHFMFW